MDSRAGIAVFVAGSVAAGAAGSASALISARAVQGVGGALIMPTTVSTVNVLFRGRERAHAFGIWGAVMAGSAAIGPLLGGALTQFADWRWVFYVNVPLGAVVLVAGWRWVPENRGEASRGFDVGGLALSAVGLGALTFGLIEGQDLGWWTPAADVAFGPLRWPASEPVSIVPIALALGVIGVGAFVRWETRRRASGRSIILDRRLFGVPSFTWGNLTAAAVAVGEFALIFVLPLFLINVLRLDILAAGVILAAIAVGAFVAGASARHLAHRFGAAKTVVLGLVLELVGTATTALVLRVGAPGWLIATTLVVYGLGLGLPRRN